jgi:DNA-3-methyladenine glycosylase II
MRVDELTKRIFLDVQPVPPFRLDLTVWTLRRRPDNLFDRWDGTTYRRVLIADDKPFEIAVTQPGENLRVAVTGARLTSSLKNQVTAALERLLGIRIDLRKFYRLSKKDSWLKPLANQFQGMKPPRLLTPFEALINAIACQQLTLTMGIRLLNRLTEAYGLALKTEAWNRPRFSASARFGEMPIFEDLRQMGFSYQKARYLTSISRLIVGGELDLDDDRSH